MHDLESFIFSIFILTAYGSVVPKLHSTFNCIPSMRE